MGMYWYNSRWYDPVLGRFIQADTIVPEPGNPGSLNRYSYTQNNPIKYTDPTGHAYCVDSNCSVLMHPVTQNYIIGRSVTVQQMAQSITEEMGGVDDLEAMAIISDVTSESYHDWSRYLSNMGEIFIGTEKTGTLALLSAIMAGGCGGIGREPRDCSGNTAYFLDTGFHEDFQDRHNQPYHVWGYIAQTATPGNPLINDFNTVVMSQWANLVHEVVQSAVNLDNGFGTSWQDYVLSEAGMEIGYQITYGLIASPSELGNTLRRELGPSGPGSKGRLQYLESTFGSLRGSP